MPEPAEQLSRDRRSNTKVIIRAWLIAGTLDITAASLYYPLMYHFRLTLLYQNIASAALGDKAFQGGAFTTALGLAFHYFIALCWTCFFFLVYPKMKFLARNLFLTGMGYGLFVWMIMNLVVLPISRVHMQAFTPGHVAIGAAFLMLCIGLPLSLIIGKYHSRLTAGVRESQS